MGGALVAEEKTVADWKSDEQAAGQIVLSAAKTAEEYPKHAKSVEDNENLLLAALPNSDFVSFAVSSWVLNCGSLGVASVKGSTDVAIAGASGAINAYHQGNLEMAANAQTTASAADYPDEMPKADGSANPAPPKKK